MPKRKKWLNKTQLAAELDLSRPTVIGYLARKGAPAPAKGGKFDLERCRAWFDRCAQAQEAGKRTTVAGTRASQLRERRLELEVEEAERAAKVRAGRLVDIEEVEPTAAAALAGLTADLRTKFEDELPSKYRGRGAAECQEMNAAAVDWVLGRLKAALEGLASQ